MNNNMCNGRKHVVKEGDTLYKISRMYDLPLAVILRANQNIEIYNLQAGQVVCIPMQPNDGMINMRPANPNKIYSYIIKDNDTLEKILSDFDLDIDDLMKMNPNGIPLRNGVAVNIPVNEK